MNKFYVANSFGRATSNYNLVNTMYDLALKSIPACARGTATDNNLILYNVAMGRCINSDADRHPDWVALPDELMYAD